MILVADTGPLIALAKVGKLHLLKNLIWQLVYIPPRVHKELWGKIGLESDAIETALEEFIQISTPKSSNIATDIVTAELGEGEKQVIRLGTSLQQNVMVLIDEQAGRRAAKALDIPLIGTAGVLLLAKRHGLVKHIIPLIIELRKQNYWFSDEFVEYLKKMSGENI
jgi:predicted nucleic acid-binding protein